MCFRVVMPCLTVPSRNSIFDTMRHGEHALTVSCRVLTCVNVLSRVFNVYTNENMKKVVPQTTTSSAGTTKSSAHLAESFKLNNDTNELFLIITEL